MTYRLMAEDATNLACKKLNINKACETATTPLPGSENEQAKLKKTVAVMAAEGRHGTLTKAIAETTDIVDDALVCECEQVSVSEVNFAIDNLHVHNLVNLRRRTRVGMGTCQGELCAARAAGAMCREQEQAEDVKADLASFINERWKGVQPVAWGANMAEAQLTATIYEGLCGLKHNAGKEDLK